MAFILWRGRVSSRETTLDSVYSLHSQEPSSTSRIWRIKEQEISLSLTKRTIWKGGQAVNYYWKVWKVSQSFWVQIFRYTFLDLHASWEGQNGWSTRPYHNVLCSLTMHRARILFPAGNVSVIKKSGRKRVVGPESFSKFIFSFFRYLYSKFIIKIE